MISLFHHFLLSFDREDIPHTEKVFDSIFKYLEVRQKYSAARRIFNSLLVWKCVQTQSVVFYILLILSIGRCMEILNGEHTKDDLHKQILAETSTKIYITVHPSSLTGSLQTDKNVSRHA